ncbi:MAG: amidohydrolase family protein, partial [Acidobacteriota bacterium]|nr:amidohydrolase family protein [Acidobacteriota bacterium]
PDETRRREIAAAAASAGLAVRIRIAGKPRRADCELASETGAVAVLSSWLAPPEWAASLPSCVQVLHPAADGEPAQEPSLFRPALDRGCPVAIATGARPGRSATNPQYLLHLAETLFGMTPEEALVAATWNASCSLRMSHANGSLEPGKAADLLIMDVPDYRELSRRPGESDVFTSMSGGRVVYRRGGLILD